MRAAVILILRDTTEGPTVGWDTGMREATSDIAQAKVFRYGAELAERVAILWTDSTVTELQIERAP